MAVVKEKFRALLISTIGVASRSSRFIAGTRFVLGWKRHGASVNKVIRNRCGSC